MVSFIISTLLLQESDSTLAGTGFNATLLEVGCGVGNAIFPLMEENKSLYVYACDLSPRAIQFVKVRQFFLCKWRVLLSFILSYLAISRFFIFLIADSVKVIISKCYIVDYSIAI